MKPSRSEEFWLSLALIVAFLVVVLSMIFAPSKARAADAPMPPVPGATCTNLTDRHTAKAYRLVAERVRVLDMAAMPSGAAGAWVMPVAGPFAWAQFHVSADALIECEVSK